MRRWVCCAPTLLRVFHFHISFKLISCQLLALEQGSVVSSVKQLMPQANESQHLIIDLIVSSLRVSTMPLLQIYSSFQSCRCVMPIELTMYAMCESSTTAYHWFGCLFFACYPLCHCSAIPSPFQRPWVMSFKPTVYNMWITTSNLLCLSLLCILSTISLLLYSLMFRQLHSCFLQQQIATLTIVVLKYECRLTTCSTGTLSLSPSYQYFAPPYLQVSQRRNCVGATCR